MLQAFHDDLSRRVESLARARSWFGSERLRGLFTVASSGL